MKKKSLVKALFIIISFVSYSIAACDVCAVKQGTKRPYESSEKSYPIKKRKYENPIGSGSSEETYNSGDVEKFKSILISIRKGLESRHKAYIKKPIFKIIPECFHDNEKEMPIEYMKICQLIGDIEGQVESLNAIKISLQKDWKKAKRLKKQNKHEEFTELLAFYGINSLPKFKRLYIKETQSIFSALEDLREVQKMLVVPKNQIDRQIDKALTSSKVLKSLEHFHDERFNTSNNLGYNRVSLILKEIYCID